MEPWVNNYISVLSFLTYAGAFNGFLLSLVFATNRKGNVEANRFFLVILLVLTIRLTGLSFQISGELWRVPFFAGTTYPLLFLIGPAFLLYTKKLWDSSYKVHSGHLLLLLPTVWAFWDASGWIFHDVEAKIEALKKAQPWVQREIKTSQLIKFGILIVHTAIYLALVVRDLKKYENSLQDISSDNDKIWKLDWLKKLSLGLFFYVEGFLITMVLLANTQKYSLLIDRAWIVILTFFIHAIGFLAIRQPRFFNEKTGKEENEENNEKYRNSPLEGAKAEEYFSRLKLLMEEERLFLNQDLKASDIASKVGIPTYQLSHLLSIKSEFNFFDFVNNYRVKEARKLLSDSKKDHLTILAIAFESGFNNKSSFNRAFKKFSGETPSNFKKKRAGL